MCTGAAISVCFQFIYNCPPSRQFLPRVLTLRYLCIAPRGAV